MYNTSVCLWSLIVLITSRYTKPFLGDVSRLVANQLSQHFLFHFRFNRCHICKYEIWGYATEMYIVILNFLAMNQSLVLQLAATQLLVKTI